MSENNQDEKLVSIVEVARLRKHYSTLVEIEADAVAVEQDTPEFKALQAAEASRLESKEYKNWSKVCDELDRTKEELAKAEAAYKRQRLNDFKNDPSIGKQYDGGNIQVRKKLVYNDVQLIDYLVNRKLGGFLLVNDRAIAELSPGALEYLEMSGFVGYEENPIATLDGDLSIFLEGEE